MSEGNQCIWPHSKKTTFYLSYFCDSALCIVQWRLYKYSLSQNTKLLILSIFRWTYNFEKSKSITVDKKSLKHFVAVTSRIDLWPCGYFCCTYLGNTEILEFEFDPMLESSAHVDSTPSLRMSGHTGKQASTAAPTSCKHAPLPSLAAREASDTAFLWPALHGIFKGWLRLFSCTILPQILNCVHRSLI